MKLIALSTIVFCTLNSYAITRNWTNTLGGSWFTATNWSPNGVPTAVDVANITNNGTYTVSVLSNSVTIASLNLGGSSGTQTLLNGTAISFIATNSGVVRANGVLSITNGGVQGNWIVQSGGQLLLEGPLNKIVSGITLLNQGTVLWSGGTLLGGGVPSVVISNMGLWNITGDNQIYDYYGVVTPSRWVNSGTVRKSAGNAISYISSFDFINLPTGAVEAFSGTLQFNGANNNSVLGGTFNATSLMSLNGGTWTDSGGLAVGTGTNQFVSGRLNLRTNIIPGLKLAGGDVYVTGTTTFQQAGAITNIVLDGSLLRGTNRVGNGAVTVNSGGVVDSMLTVQPGGQLLFAGSLNKVVNGMTLVNQGTVLWSGGTLLGGGNPSVVISNMGLWNITGDNQIYDYYGVVTPSRWVNSGTVRKSAGNAISYISSFDFINLPTGVVETFSGTLQFNGGGVLGGTFNATSVMSLNGGTWTDSGGMAIGSGTNQFSSGRLNLRTNIIPGLKLTGGDVYVTGSSTFQQAGAITNIVLDGSLLRGTNRIGNGAVTLNSGGVVDSMLTVQPGGQLLFAGSLNKVVNGMTLVNQGTVLWSGGTLLGGGNPSVVISNMGLWNITGDNQIYDYYGVVTPSRWVNSGTVRKSAGNAISYISSFDFINLPTGVVEAFSGTLQFNGGGVLGGTFNATSVMSLNGGTWTDSGGMAIGSGTNQFSSGRLNLRTNIIPGLKLTGGDVYVTGSSTFQQAGAITNIVLDGSLLKGTNRIGNGAVTVNSGGVVDGVLTVQSPGQLLYQGPLNKYVNGLTLLNQGTVHWNGGTLLGGGNPSVVISNMGLWNITGDNQIYDYYGVVTPSRWVNSGTVRKSAGTATSHISSFAFINEPAGIIESDTGILQLPAGFTNSAGTLLLKGGALQSGSTLAMTGGALQGIGAVWANLISGGIVSPGTNGPGLMQFPSSLGFRAGATLSLAGTNTAPGTYDQLTVVGTVVLSNATLQVTSLPTVPIGTTFIIITNDSNDAVQGTFAGLPENALISVSGQTFAIHYAGGNGNDVTLQRAAGNAAAQLAAGGYSNGVWRLAGQGNASTLITVQGSTNFIHWTNLGTVVSDGTGNFTFIDTNAVQFRYRFYRAAN